MDPQLYKAGPQKRVQVDLLFRHCILEQGQVSHFPVKATQILTNNLGVTAALIKRDKLDFGQVGYIQKRDWA